MKQVTIVDTELFSQEELKMGFEFQQRLKDLSIDGLFTIN
jgi:hypothetical protein